MSISPPTSSAGLSVAECVESATLIQFSKNVIRKKPHWSFSSCAEVSYTIEILGFTPSGFSPTRLYLVVPSDGLSRPFGVAVGLPTYPSLICHWA